MGCEEPQELGRDSQAHVLKAGRDTEPACDHPGHAYLNIAFGQILYILNIR